MAKQNVRASIIVYANVPELGGWRRGQLAPTKTGFRTDVAKFGGVVYPTPSPAYKIRTYVGSKAVYTPAGDDLAVALDLAKKEQATRQKKAANAVLGIVEPKAADAPKTMAELVDEYITRKSRKSIDLSDTSIRHYKDALLGFLKVCPKMYVAEVVEDDVVAFIDHLLEQGYSDKTQGMRYVTLRGFLRRSGLDVEKVVDSATHSKFLEKAKKQGEKTEGYTDAELAKFFAECDEYHRVAFQFLLYTGLRYREANHLTWDRVDFTKKVIRVKEEEVKRTFQSRKANARVTKAIEAKVKSKSGIREVPISPSLRPILLQWRKDHPNAIYVFGTKNDLPDNHWLEYGNAAWHRAGLDCGDCDGCAAREAGSRSAGCEEFFLHRFRHSFGHRCADAGIDIDTVRQWMGHYATGVTQIYFRGRKYAMTIDPFAGTNFTKVVSIAAA